MSIRTVRMLLPALAFALLLLAVQTGARLSAQPAPFTVSPTKVEFQMVAGGPVAVPARLTISAGATVAWKAAVNADASEWLAVSPASGNTPASITLTLPSWWAAGRPTGKYQATVTLTPAAGTAVDVSVVLTVVAHVAPPVFTTVAGPNHCRSAEGYLDPAICDVPDEKPPGNFQPPAPGGTYVDGNFGTTVKLLTKAPCFAQYSSPSAVSANNKYVSTSCGIVDLATGKVVYDLPSVWGSLDGMWSAWNAGAFWDAADDDLLYFLSEAKLIRRSLSKKRNTTVVDFGRQGFTSISKGGTGDTSKDNWVPIFAPQEKQLCAVNLATADTYCTSYANLSGPPIVGPVDFVNISKGVDSQSGKRYVVMHITPAVAVFSVNLAAKRLDFEFRGPEDPESTGNHDGICDVGERCYGGPAASHAETMEDSAGIQYIVDLKETSNPCQEGLITLQINKGQKLLTPVELGGGLRAVMPVFQCGVPWPDDHVGCAKRAPYCVISTNYVASPRRNPTDRTPITRTPHLSEFIVMRENGAEIRRIVEHRSVLFSNEEASSYWSTPRASISPDGGWVVGTSNFGEPNSQYVMAVRTGYGASKIAAAGVVNGASFEPSIAPGAIVTITGANLANCVASADPPPWPTTLCDVSVVFGDKPATFFYASPSQLNVLMPTGPYSTDGVRLSVSVAGWDPDSVTLSPDMVTDTAPAMFTYTLEDGIKRAVVQNSDYSLNGPGISGSRPLRPGEPATIYANGLGPTDPVVADGDPAPLSPLAQTVYGVEVYVNDVLQKVMFSGLTPYFSGLFQVNFTLDPSTPIHTSDDNQLWLRQNGTESSRATISITPGGL